MSYPTLTHKRLLTVRRLILSASMAAAIMPSRGQTLHGLTGASYTQNFDGTGSLLPVGWGFGQGVPFASTTISSTQTGGTVGSGILTGSSPAGAYHFVNGTVGVDNDRSIGYITGSAPFTNNRDIIFGFRNSTGQSITALSLTFDYEKYRSGFSSRDWSFFASASDTSWGSPFAGGAQSYAGDANSTTVFAPPLSISKSVTIGGISIAPDASYFFRWNYNGAGTGGGAQALGLDNLTLSATLIGGILYWDTNGALAGLGGTGLWDAASMNWNPLSDGTGTPVAPTADRELIFSGTAGTVTVGSGAAANAGITFSSGGYLLSGGTLALGGTAPATITITNGTHTATISSAISGAAGLKKAGLGKLALTGANSFSGGTIISAGTLEVSSDQNFGAANGAVSLSGGTLKTNSSVTLSSTRSLTGSGSIDIAPSTTLLIPGTTAAGNIVLKNIGTLRLSGTAPSVDSLAIEEPGLIESGSDAIQLAGPLSSSHAAGTATISASLNLGNSFRTFTIGDGTAGVDLLISGNLAGGTGGRLIKLGAGTLSLTGTNSGLPGGIQLGSPSATGGTLAIQSGSALGPGGPGGAFIFHSGTLLATTALTGANAIPAAVSLTFGGSSTLSSSFGGSPFEFLGPAQFSGTDSHAIVANTDVSISGAVSGSSPAIAIRGTGKFTLESGGSFSGDVTVDGGNLVVNGGFTGATRPVISVIQSGSLGGNLTTGSLGALIASSGTLSPGNFSDFTGTLISTSSGFAIDVLAAGKISLQLGGAGVADYDRFIANGQVRLAGDLLVSLINGFTPSVGTMFTIISNDGVDAVSGAFAGLPEGFTLLAGTTTFAVNYGGGDGNDVTLTAVPEPASAVFLLAGLAVAARRRRTQTI